MFSVGFISFWFLLWDGFLNPKKANTMGWFGFFLAHLFSLQVQEGLNSAAADICLDKV